MSALRMGDPAMEKTLAALMLTLVISVMGIPAAYLVGQRSAQETLHRQYQAELARARAADDVARTSAPTQAPPVARHGDPVHGEPAFESQPVHVAQPPPAPAIEAPAEPAGPPIAEETFEAAVMGTPYGQVVREFGREGVPMMTLEDGTGSVTTQYVWDWLDPEGNPSRIRMQFVDGRLSEKTFTE